jgi:hypothetical protein
MAAVGNWGLGNFHQHCIKIERIRNRIYQKLKTLNVSFNIGTHSGYCEIQIIPELPKNECAKKF